jgi:hypothetical protein
MVYPFYQEKGRVIMKKLSLVVIILGLLLTSAPVFAAQQAQPLTVNMAVSARAKLTLGVGAINFADADPDTTPSIPATENAVSVTAKIRTGASSTATLTHRAGGNLSAGGAITIPINNVSWTATGAGYVAGTMSSSSDVPAASWTGSNSYGGTFSFFIVNSWTYTTGNYTVSATYTLTAP